MSSQRLQEVRFAQRVLVEAIPKAFRRIIKPGCGCKIQMLIGKVIIVTKITCL